MCLCFVIRKTESGDGDNSGTQETSWTQVTIFWPVCQECDKNSESCFTEEKNTPVGNADAPQDVKTKHQMQVHLLSCLEEMFCFFGEDLVHVRRIVFAIKFCQVKLLFVQIHLPHIPAKDRNKTDIQGTRHDVELSVTIDTCSGKFLKHKTLEDMERVYFGSFTWLP